MMTELEIAQLEAMICTRTKNPEPIDKDTFFVLKAVPRLIAEIRRLHILNPKPSLAVVILPEAAAVVRSDVSNAVESMLRDVGEIIEECCPDDGKFLLTFFGTKGDDEPIYVFNAGRDQALKALRRVVELVEQS